jgi:hypothetical protein
MPINEAPNTIELSNVDDVPPPFSGVYAYWLNLLSPNAIAPDFKDFRLDELEPRILPWSILVDVKTAPLDFTYRFWGTERSKLIGMELTGKSTADIPTSFMRESNIREYNEVITLQKPLLCQTPVVTSSGRQVTFQSIRLPICDGQNNTVTHIYSAMNYKQITEASYEYYGTHAVGQ